MNYRGAPIGTHYHKSYDEATILEFVTPQGKLTLLKDKLSQPTQSVFSLTGYTYKDLPRSLKLKNFHSRFMQYDLVCPNFDPTVSLETCKNYSPKNNQKNDNVSGSDSDSDSKSDEQNEEPQKCWCQLFWKLVNQGGEVKSSILLEGYDYRGTDTNIFWLINIGAEYINGEQGEFFPTFEERQQKWDTYPTYIQFEFERYYPNYKKTKKRKVKLSYLDKKKNKMVKIKSDYYSLSTAKFEFQLDQIPDQFIVSLNDQEYKTNPIIACNKNKSRFKNECLPKSGWCWCSFINCIRSNGEASMTVNMVSTGGTSYYDYTMSILALRDPDDHNQITVAIEFEIEYKNQKPHYNNKYYRNQPYYNNLHTDEFDHWYG